MLKSADQMRAELRQQMRGGDGEVCILHFLEAQELGGPVRLAAKLTLGPGCSIGPHVHEGEQELFYVTSGSGVYLDNGTEKPFGTGDSMLCGAGERHGVRNTGESPLEILAVIVTL